MDFETILVIPTVLIRNGGSGSLTMKIRNGKYGQRKAISPIIATVLIIAVTLIAAVAIGGFVFGIFGTSSQSAQISVTNAALTGTDFTTGGAATYTCATTATAGVSITLTNTGTAGASVTGATITWAGASNAFTLASGTCSVGGAGSPTATTYLVFANPGLVATNAGSGQAFSGTITLSNGAQVLFSGTWQ
jgi:flagellin-like protein